MTYLTYEEYSNSLGGALDLTAFNRYIDRACGIIDNETHNRIECMAEVPQRVKALCRDLIEFLANGFGSSKQVSSHSQSAGGVSESEMGLIQAKGLHKYFLVGFNQLSFGLCNLIV